MTAAFRFATVLVAAAALFLAGAAQAESRNDIQRTIIEEALNSEVPPALALAVGRVESNFDAAALSSAGARGVMQIMPATARGEYGVDPDELWDARLNIQLGIDFLDQLYKRYGSWELALSHYNAGSVQGTGVHARILPVTRRYVASVLRWERRYAEYAAIWQPERLAPAWTPARTRAARAAIAADDQPDSEIGRAIARLAADVERRETELATAGRIRNFPAPSLIAEARREAETAAAQLAAEVDRRNREIAAATRTRRVRARPIVADGGRLDDFGADIFERRLRARVRLDDFPAIVRSSDG